jgi:hypothetical protein
LPITLVLLDRALAQNSWLYGVAAGTAGAMLVLGRDQVALLGVYILIALVVWRVASHDNPRSAAVSALRPLIAGTVAGLMMIAVPVILTVLVAEQSNRPAITLIEAGKGSLHPALFLTAVAPDLFGSSGRMWDYWGPPSFAWNTSGLFLAQNMGQLYIGAIPLLILFAGAASGALWLREIRFVTLALVATTLYALGWYTPFFAAIHALVPGVDLYRRPADAVFLMGFLAAILTGYALNVLLDETTRERLIVGRARVLPFALVAVGFAICIGLAITMDRVGMAAKPLGVAIAIFMASFGVLMAANWFQPHRPMVAAAMLLAGTVVDLAYSNGPGSATALPPAHYDVLEPTTNNATIAFLKRMTAEGHSDTRRDRIELVGLGFHWPNASMTHNLEHTLGYNPLRLGTYSRATGAEDTVGLPEQRKFTPLFPGYHSMLADMLGLRWIASSVPIEQVDKLLKAGDLDLVATTPDGSIYENRNALPRVMFATTAQSANFEALLTTGKWPEFNPRQTVLLETPKPESTSGLGAARLVETTNTTTIIEADSTEGGYVVLNDIWHPWWRATVDGVESPLLKANVLFRAVAVPPGRHRVRFAFEPIRGAWTQLFQRKQPTDR